MGRKLIKAREGVYGRQATDEERERFREFMERWKVMEEERSRDIRAELKKFIAKYKRSKLNT